MSERASGWYDDPDDPTQLRYWDGILWTERRTPKVKPGLDGSQIGTPSAYEPAPAQASQQPEPRASQQPTNPDAGPQQSTPSWPGGQAAPARPTTPEGQRLSGWWRRFIAWVIDGILVGVLGTAIGYPWASSWIETYRSYVSDVMGAASRGETSSPEMPQSLYEIPVGWMVAILAVYAVYEIGLTVWRGRTLGKMVTGISVRLAEAPRKPTFDEAVKRFAVKGIASILNPIPLLAVFGTMFTIVDGVWPLGDRRKQSIHDKVAATVVVVGPPSGAPSTQPPTYGPVG